VNDTAAKSWAHALELLYATSWQPALHRFRSTLAYRGVSRVDHDLAHGLSRLADQPATVEQHLLRNFRKYAEERPEARFDSTWHWLALAQHHGLPTRLLDWTYSPLVALHFATAQAEAVADDGVVWCVDYVAAKRQLPQRLRSALDKETCDVFTPELLAEAVITLEELDRLADAPVLVFLEPPALDQRIVAQYALFSLLTSPDAPMRTWIAAHTDICTRVVIPAAVKLEIRDKLDQANITERVLYPGLDGLCA
jgi:FRG domain-containing protein